MKTLENLKRSVFEPDISPLELEKRRQLYVETFFEKFNKHEKSFLARLTLSQLEKLHPFFSFGIKINNRFQGAKPVIVSDERISSDKPKIYAATHIGKMDIEILLEAIDNHVILLTSGFERIYQTFYAFGLGLNGAIYFCFYDKSDRKRAFQKMEEILQSGGNILIFPEGAYNISPNLLVLPLNWGVIKAAQSTGAQIVPVAVEQYGRRFKVAFGSFDVSEYEKNDEGASAGADGLRDAMADLVWKIMESEPVLGREQANRFSWENYVKRQLKNSGDTVEDAERERYRPNKYAKF